MTDQPIVGPDGKPIHADPPDDRWFIPDPNLIIRMHDRPMPHPDGPFAPPPNQPAIPQYDEKGIGPGGPVQQHQEDSEAKLRADHPDHDEVMEWNRERNRRMQAAATDLIVVLKANAGPFIKAMNEAAEAINRLYAAYVSGLPWYRRWPIQIKMWWRRRAWRLHL